MIDIAKFRRTFVEFSCVNSYSVDVITFWYEVALGFVGEKRWGSFYEKGLFLYVAHCLKLFAGENSGADNGGSVSSKAVGSVSVGFDSSGSNPVANSALNQTKYGRQFIQLQRLVGRGCALV